MWKSNLALFRHVTTLNEAAIIEAKKNDQEANFQLVDSKKEVPTLQVTQNDRVLFIHSKYNPTQEAARIMKNVAAEIEARDHIIFYGVGLGYHIEEVVRQYPDKVCTIIEPNIEVFLRFLESRSLTNFPTNQVAAIYVPTKDMSLQQFITGLMTDLRGNAAVVLLPAYERLFKDEVKHFFELYQEALKTTRSTVAAQRAFSKRWVINSLKNLPQTTRTRNIVEMKEYFKGKPIIIAAAGPSLFEDIDQLKYIKEHGLAYIFAVGSANKAFMAHDITPDAVLTYDPQPHNVNVFQELMASGRTDIPMIYGTSVGFETTEAYPGPLFHFVNSADTVTNYYLGKKEDSFDVHDSTTITLVAIQVAELLEAATIILAGQNLAFKENRYYAEGIKHWTWTGEVRAEHEGKEVVLTEDVYGNSIETNESLNNMRRDIELYIEQSPHLKIINTTKKGAAIKGAPFNTLEAVTEGILTEKVVDKEWNEQDEVLISETTRKQVRKMEGAIGQMYDLFYQLEPLLEKVQTLKESQNVKQISRTFTSFDRAFNRFIQNDMYRCFIAPILKIELEQLKKHVALTNQEEDLAKRIDMIVITYVQFLQYVQEVFNEMIVHIQESVHPQLGKDDKMEIYAHHDGVFHYEGDWEREVVAFSDLSRGETVRKLSETISTKSSEKGARISFRFEGTMLQLFAQTGPEYSSNISVTIDGKERRVRTNEQRLQQGLTAKLGQQVLEVRALPNKVHEVTIELLDDAAFHFQGIAINEHGRVYHVDEVTKVEALEVGKRIRCHYCATVNTVGEFSGIGKASGNFISVSAEPNPDGDFYFIMVDDIDGEKKLIADRNVQNYISWNTLYDYDLTNLKGKKVIIDEIEMKLRLLTGGANEGCIDNEWDEYLNKVGHLKENVYMWNGIDDIASWVAETYEKNTRIAPRRTLLEGLEYRINELSYKNESKANNGFRPCLIG